AVRRSPNRADSVVSGGLGRHRVLASYVPRKSAADDLDLLLRSQERKPAAAPYLSVGVRPLELHTHPGGCVVDGRGVVGHLERRPGSIWRVRLAKGVVRAVAGILDGCQLRRTKGARSCLERGISVLGPTGERGESRDNRHRQRYPFH